MPSNALFDDLMSSLSANNDLAATFEANQNCFLKAHLPTFSEASRTRINENGWVQFLAADSDEPDNLATLTSNGIYQFNEIRRMNNIQKAMLIPKVRLYKAIVSRTTGEIIREIPITFPDSSSENINSLLQNKNARGDDIGIESFDFDIQNQNPFAAKRMSACTLKLKMVSGHSLTTIRDEGFRFADLLIRNNRVNPDNYESDFYIIKAVVGYEVPDDAQFADNDFKVDIDQNKITLIMTLVDYDITFEQNGHLGLTLNYISRIEQRLSSNNKYNIFEDKEFERGLESAKRAARGRIAGSQNNIRLAEQQYEADLAAAKQAFETRFFNIPEVGEVKGKKAVGEFEFTTSEGLQVKKKYEDIIQTEETFFNDRQAQLDSYKKEVAALKASFQAIVATEKGNVEAEKSRLVYMKNQNRIEKYRQLMKNMFQFGKVRRLAIPKTSLLIVGKAYEEEEAAFLDKRVASGTTTAEIDAFRLFVANERINSRTEIRNQILNSGASITAAEKDDLISALDAIAIQLATEAGKSDTTLTEVLRASTAFVPETLSTRAGSAVFAHSTRMDGVRTTGPAPYNPDLNKKIIYYFYLGDLIQSALMMNGSYSKLVSDNLAIILGNMRLETPDPEDPTRMIVANINLADFPITVESFLRFFRANVLNLGLDVYPLMNFIQDVVQRLLMPSVNAECFGNIALNQKTFKTKVFSLPANVHTGTVQEPLTAGAYGSDTDPRTFYRRALYEAAGAGTRVNIDNHLFDGSTGLLGDRARLSRTPTQDTYGYVLIYATTREEDLRYLGDEDVDAANGIFHFYLGADSGLVKSINFQKQQNSQLALVMAERALKAGKEKIELWRNFSATLDMFGNSLLAPGSFIYINPTISGLGSPESIESLGRSMGLGGYYMVLRVNNTIDSSGWNTRAEAVWQSVPPA